MHVENLCGNKPLMTIFKNKRSLLTGPKGTETICSGDSGSPLMVDQGGRLIHVGLTSFGLTDCSSLFPSVFSRTSFYLEWMRAAITPVP